MEEHLFRVKAVKPTRNAHNKFGNFTNCKRRDKPKDFDPLTTKNAIKLLLEGTLKYKVCKYCLCIVSQLSELDEIYEVARKGAIYKVTLRDMIACVHPFKSVEDPNLPDKICERCIESAISSYFFSQQCEQAERALRNCFDDMYDKFEKLDPIERGKKRGRQKLNPNPNVLYTENEKVIDYAEPIINIVNIGTESHQDAKEISPLECPKCWQELPDVETLLNHETLHPKSMWYTCRLCGQSFVKHRQYKKHIKEKHSHDFIVPVTKDSSFKCKECGYLNQTFAEHLQHMEKHKFKNTFENLINRNLNTLCAVCLEKGSCMIHMNETIHMYGGYPGVNNEMTINSILSSTLPEQKSYKYQELLVPTRANIMTITKRIDSRQPKNLTVIYEKTKKIFHFCKPIIISTLNIKFETLYVFKLCEPIILNQLCYLNKEESMLDKTLKISYNKSCNKVGKKLDKINKQINKIDKNMLSLDVIILNDSQVDANIASNNTESKQDPTCKTCWIFGKPSCQKCLTNIFEDVDMIMENTKCDLNNSKEKCKFCWLFQSAGKCNYCKKILTNYDETSKSNSSKNIDYNVQNRDSKSTNNQSILITEKHSFENIDSQKLITGDRNGKSNHINNVQNEETKSIKNQSRTISDTETKDHIHFDNIESHLIPGTRKRKTNQDDIESQKRKWQCKICLTNNNVNRQTCFCCEFDSCMDSQVKFNFGTNKNIFEILKDKTKSTKMQKCLDENEIAESRNFNNDSKVETKAWTSFQQYIPEENKIVYNNKDTVPMDIEVNNEPQNIRRNSSNIINLFKKDELMDVTYEEGLSKSAEIQSKPPSIVFFNPSNTSAPNKSITSSQNLPFQFTIGSSSKDHTKQVNRRYLRPMRRMANMGRK